MMTAFENAIQALVVAATSLPGSKVIWANQTRDRPLRPFVELAYLEETTTKPEWSSADTPGLPAGAELTLSSREHTEPLIQVRVFSSAVTGDSAARNIAKNIRAFFGRETTQYTLRPYALVSRGTVRDASFVLETEHEGRAILDLRFRAAQTDTETTTFIETATVETTVQQSSGPPVVRNFSIDLDP